MAKSELNNSLRCKPTKRLLGTWLLDGGFILPQDLEKALQEQLLTNEFLGEILVRMGVLNLVDLDVLLSIQQDCVSLENAVALAVGVHQLLGELLIQAKRITPEQLENILRDQLLSGKKIGQVLVDKGLLTEQELDRFFAFQEQQDDHYRTERLRLGQLLVATKQISREQLKVALKRQQLEPHKKIGELLIEAQYITPEQVAHGLKLQHRLLTAVLAAILSLTSPISSVTKHSEATLSHTQTVESETASLRLTLNILYQIPDLVVTNADVVKGFVEVKSASRIEIKSNVFFFLSFNGLKEPFERVYISGFGKKILVDKEGSSILLPDLRGFATFELNYKFILSKDAQPGTYSWPVTISSHPAMSA